MTELYIETKYLQELIRIFTIHCPRALIWAIGSRTNGKAHPGSDLDLVIADFGEEECEYAGMIESIKESNIPFLIDFSILNKLPQSYQQEIKRHYVVLYDGRGK